MLVYFVMIDHTGTQGYHMPKNDNLKDMKSRRPRAFHTSWVSFIQHSQKDLTVSKSSNEENN